MYTFIGELTRFLEERGVPFTRRLDDAFDVLFVNSWAVPYETVRAVKRERPDVRVVQRVDGAARDYGRTDDADDRQARVNLLADLTIFQSRYSRHSVRTKFKVIAQDGPVIYNPVDLDRFTLAGARRDVPGRIRVANAAWSINRLKGTWQIDRLAAENPDVDFVLCGRYDHLADHPNVHRLGYLGRDDLAAALRSCDVFLNLSENDPCPNVVTEALASGLPVIYRDSGGVPELAGECGIAIDGPGFRGALDQTLARREELGVAARARAERLFAPSVVFPLYLEAMDASQRRPEPTRAELAALVREGYPVRLRYRSRLTALARSAWGHAPSSLRQTMRGFRDASEASRKPHRIGWVTHDAFPARKRRFDRLEPFTRMRAGQVAEWINSHSDRLHNELYRPGERYDVVVFTKMMDARCRAEAERIRSGGGRVVFDANVNYYEVWGDYVIPDTRPTDEQQADAVWMTRFADHVVADSTYLAAIIERITPRVTWIPDNVNLDVYAGERVHQQRGVLRLAWSGIAKKAAHLLPIGDVLAGVSGIELVIVTDRTPECLGPLEGRVPLRVIAPFSDARYADVLRDSDVIISPKRLCNGYELGHTEYKIALGMALGLPAVASPQQSYVEALAGGGGIIADTPEAWQSSIERLRDDVDLRRQMGLRARRTILERYSTGVVALRYLELLERLVRTPAHATT